MEVVLIGNANVGKSSLFNVITHSRQTVGNWSGVTVAATSARLRVSGGSIARCWDLPGLPSLTADTPERRLVLEHLSAMPPDVVVNVVDCTNLSRSLLLTQQLLAWKLPLLVALNKTDMLPKRGFHVDAAALSRILGVPCIPVSAETGMGIPRLLAAIAQMIAVTDVQTGMLEQKIGSLLPEKDWAAEAGAVAEAVCRKTGRDRNMHRSDRLDDMLCHPLLALPCVAVALGMLFFLSFGPPGRRLQELCGALFLHLTAAAEKIVSAYPGAESAVPLLTEGLLPGVGSVLSFLPQLVLVFAALSFLEGSGYLARCAYFSHAPLARVGLSGMSMIPLLLGFGCTVPSVMACRLLDDEALRRRTMLVVPHLSCAARTPVYLLLLSSFFQERVSYIIPVLYLLGIFAGLLWAGMAHGKEAGKCFFCLEMPLYRLPSLSEICQTVWSRCGEYISRAGSTIVLASACVWLLQHFGRGDGGVLRMLGERLTPLFAPLGLSDWRLVIALFSGFLAKEAIVSTLAVLLAGMPISSLLTPASALSMSVFVLLYPPCVAALSVIRRESGSLLFTVGIILRQLAAAWIAAFFLYQIGYRLF